MGYAGLQCGALFSDFRRTVNEECADSRIEVPRIVADSPLFLDEESAVLDCQG